MPVAVVHVRAPAQGLAEVVEDRAALLGDRQDILEKILDLEDLVGDVAQDLLEAAVLLAGAVAVEDVVEEQLLHHGGDHPVDLGPRQVHEDRLQFPDLGGDAEAHAGPRSGERGILQESPANKSRGLVVPP
jgi:hypothetical protein